MTYTFPYQNLDLYHTLISGQTFEWTLDKENNIWHGNIYSNPVSIKQTGDKNNGILEYEAEINLDQEINKYFGFEEDYEDLINRISFDDQIKITLDKLNGLRIIRQDPWFCINSFILSSNNTVKNIQAILKNITSLVNPNYDTNHYQFPGLKEVKSLTEQDLRNCKAGFRAKYLLDFYKRVENEPDFIESIKILNYDEGKEKLMSIKGIGEKVADCILLYAYGKYEAYPLDTHLRQATIDGYFAEVEKKPNDKEIRKWAKEYWKSLAGFAHFFLFTYHRLYGKIK